jgi:hypothetical protein
MKPTKSEKPGWYFGKTKAYRIGAGSLIATLLKPLERNGVHEGDELELYFKEHNDGTYDIILRKINPSQIVAHSEPQPIKEAAI